MEQWVVIEGFPNYSVSDEGRIFSRYNNRILTTQQSNSGYAQILMQRNKQRYVRYIHRLVAQHFLNVDLTNMEVNHIDGNKYNNCVWNLEVCTPQQNSQHAYDIGLSTASGTKRVRIVETGEEFASISACARALNRALSGISYAIRNGTRVSGYHYEFVEGDR